MWNSQGQEVQANSSGDAGEMGEGSRHGSSLLDLHPHLHLRLLSDKVLSSIIWKFDALRSAAQAGPLLPSEILALTERPTLHLLGQSLLGSRGEGS